MKSFEEKKEKTAEKLGINPQQIPRHVAIIMDGNGRWAQAKDAPRVEGHRQGGKVVENIALDCVDLGIEFLTLYSFSVENWKRPKSEINALMYLYQQYLIGIRPMMEKNQVKLVHLGTLDNVPDDVRKALAETKEITANNKGMVLALALNYGGREEIVDATKKIAQEYKDGQIQLDDIDKQCVNEHLYTAKLPDPDLLIRTANEMRISNFLLWQISYSEFYVTKTFWPDFCRADMEEAIVVYANRKRRFGNIK